MVGAVGSRRGREGGRVVHSTLEDGYRYRDSVRVDILASM